MTDRTDRTADMIRRIPIMRGRGAIIPPSQVYGNRWRTLPVEGAGRPPHGSGIFFGCLFTLAMFGAVYIFARFVGSFWS